MTMNKTLKNLIYVQFLFNMFNMFIDAHILPMVNYKIILYLNEQCPYGKSLTCKDIKKRMIMSATVTSITEYFGWV